MTLRLEAGRGLGRLRGTKPPGPDSEPGQLPASKGSVSLDIRRLRLRLGVGVRVTVGPQAGRLLFCGDLAQGLSPASATEVTVLNQVHLPVTSRGPGLALPLAGELFFELLLATSTREAGERTST